MAIALLLTAALAACGGSATSTVSADAPPAGGAPSSLIRITAYNIEFEPADVTVPADRPFTILLDNRDEGVPHDIAIKDAGGNWILQSAIITGLAQERVEVAPLAPGTYPFVCTIHPNMVGEITAE